MSERRTERLVNPAYSELPAFLTHRGGLESGFMLAHCTAAALVSENKVREMFLVARPLESWSGVRIRPVAIPDVRMTGWTVRATRTALGNFHAGYAAARPPA